MKIRKVLAALIVMVIAFSAMTGTAFAKEPSNALPFSFPNDQYDCWVKLIGGGEVISTSDVSARVRSVDITFEGKAAFDAQLVYNYDGGWVPTDFTGQSVDGSLVLSMPMDGSLAPSWCEVVVYVNNLQGNLSVTKMEFKDEAGKVILAHGTDANTEESQAPASFAPQTGIEGLGTVYGLGALLFASGAVFIRRKKK